MSKEEIKRSILWWEVDKKILEKLFEVEVDRTTAIKIAIALGFREHPKEAGVYFKDIYSDPDSKFVTEYITFYYDSRGKITAQIEGTQGRTFFFESKEVVKYPKTFPSLVRFIYLRADKKRALEFLEKEKQR